MTVSSPNPQPPYPLSKELLPFIDPQYVEFYNKYIIDQQQVHYQPVEASRGSGPIIPGGGKPIDMASITDYEAERVETTGPPVKLRVFVPQGSPPDGEKWGVLIYLHGGGWVLGNIGTENSHCTNWADRGKCIVVSVDYRLAPEDVFPAAVDDTWEGYLWILANADRLGFDKNKIAVGGSSAGGNLSAVLTHMITERKQKDPNFEGPQMIFQMLIVPVCDNTATGKTYESWKVMQNTVALPAEKMMWYRYKYLPDDRTWSDPRASPIFYPDDSFNYCPPAFFALAGLDVLRSEGLAYADKLRDHGIETTVKIYKGVPHPVMAMDGVLDTGKELVTDCCKALYSAFHV